MFTGVIESLGEVKEVRAEGGNRHLTLISSFTPELKIDQSISHNGVCLTVISKGSDAYTVTAVDETLKRSNLDRLVPGSRVNLERAMVLGSRLDGHLVQGHVDQVAQCTDISEINGSYSFGFTYDPSPEHITVHKGSITIDGVSLTITRSLKNEFSVAIIPYTFAHTLFQEYKVGSVVNLEFDIIGKYVARLLNRDNP